MTATLYCGDALAVLRTLPDALVQCCVSSPPYWGLRDYGVTGQQGLEATPEEYVAKMVEVFREVRRVLREDGTLWLNMGDSYNSSPSWGRGGGSSLEGGIPRFRPGADRADGVVSGGGPRNRNGVSVPGLKPKDLVGIPWRLAFALQADGWWLRSDIIWSKPNPMPESVTDRPTKAHEYVFLLSKAATYYYDAAAIAEDTAKPEYVGKEQARWGGKKAEPGRQMGRTPSGNEGKNAAYVGQASRNARTVWEIATQPYAAAHFATFPEELARRCIIAGSRPGDCVLDPFGGSGTVAQVATGNGRSSVYIDLNPAYLELAKQRIGPMLCEAL